MMGAHHCPQQHDDQCWDWIHGDVVALRGLDIVLVGLQLRRLLNEQVTDTGGLNEHSTLGCVSFFTVCSERSEKVPCRRQ